MHELCKSRTFKFTVHKFQKTGGASIIHAFQNSLCTQIAHVKICVQLQMQIHKGHSGNYYFSGAPAPLLPPLHAGDTAISVRQTATATTVYSAKSR